MPHAGNLTREVARHRSRTVTLHGYAVRLDLTHAPDAEVAEFESTSRLRLTCTESSVEIDLVADDAPQETLDGENVPVEFIDSRVRIDGLTPGATHDIVITARCAYSHTGEGLHRYADPEDGDTYSLHALRADGRPPRLRVLRPARPQGALRRQRHRAHRLAGALERRA